MCDVRRSIVTSVTLLLILSFGLTPAADAQSPAMEMTKPELVPQTGHTYWVQDMAFSPNGRWLATGSFDGTIILWEVATGREVRTLRGHTLGVSSVAFSPDGRWLISGSADKTIKVWEVATGLELRTLTGHADVTTSVEFSPDGKHLASASGDKTIKLWEVATGREVRTLSGHTSTVNNIAFSRDGRTLASGGAEKALKLWDVATGLCIRTLAGHTAGVTGVSISPDGRSLASSSFDSTVRLWDVATGRELLVLRGHTKVVLSVAFNPDGRLLASGSFDQNIKIWEVATGQELRTIVDPSNQIASVAFSPDGRQVASAGGDFVSVNPPTTRLWDVGTGRQVGALVGQTSPGVVGFFSVDARWLSSQRLTGSGLTLKLLEISTGKAYGTELQRPAGFEGELPIAQLAAGYQFFRSYQVEFPGLSFNSRASFGGKSARLAAALTGSAPGMIAWSVKNSVKLLDLSSIFSPPRTFAGHTSEISALSLSSDGRLLASASNEDKTVGIWETATGQELRSLTGVVNWGTALAFSPDGHWLAAGSKNTVKLWEVATGHEVRAVMAHPEEVRSVAFSPDGHWLASGSNNAVKLWDVVTGRELRTLAGHTSFVIHLAFSPDGRWLVSTNVDGSTRIWDPKSGEEVALLVFMAGSNDWLAVTPDGLFDGTEQGMQKLVGWRIGSRVYPPDRFFADYYTPGLLSRIFAGERLKPDVDLARLKLPPDVRIISPPSAGTTNKKRAIVTVEAQDLGGGVAEVRIYQNGKLVGTRDGVGGKSSNYAFELDLVPGENVLKAVALTQERVESNEDWVRVVFQTPQVPKPALHILVVGINKYEDSAFNLGFARQDGEAIAEFFGQRASPMFSSVNALKLFDKDATQANIRKAFEQLAERAQPEDVVLVYLAGHGIGLGQQFYFLPHEMRTEEDEEAAIRKYGVSASVLGDALRRIPALKQALILDTCQSGSALPVLAKMVGFRGGLAEQRAAKMLARANGLFLIAASTKRQYAVEVPELGHGVLTSAILSGLGEKGKPEAAATPDGVVTIMAILQYVSQQVPELTEKYHGGEKQYPVSFTTGMDFPLVVK